MANATPQWKLRRLAPRTLRIVKRRAGTSPSMSAYAASIGPQAEHYIAVYDGTVTYAATRKKEMAEGHAAVTGLLKQIHIWVPMLVRDVPGFDGSIYGDQPQVPDDVIEDGERLLTVVDQARTEKGEPLPYRQQALDVLGPMVALASKEWEEAESVDKEYQTKMAELRTLADQFRHNLVALRRTLLAEAGHTDRDYQKLRAERAGIPDEDDDPNAPVAPTKSVPAPPA